jgi:hypothetical protein
MHLHNSVPVVILHLCLLIKFCVIFTVIRGIYLGPRSTLSTEVNRQMLLDTSPIKATSNCLEERGLYTKKCTNYFFFNFQTGYDVLRSSLANTERGSIHQAEAIRV